MTFSLCLVGNNNGIYSRELLTAESVFISLKIKFTIINVFDVTELKTQLENSLNIILFDAANTVITSDEFVDKVIVSNHKAIIVILCTNLQQMCRLLPVKPFGIVDKNNAASDLTEILIKGVNKIKNENQKPLIFKLSNGLIKVLPNEFLYLENAQIYLSTGENYSVVIKKEKLKEKMSDKIFLWLKPNCVLNIKHIDSFEKSHIKMKNGKIFDINRKLSFTIKKQINAVLY